MFEWTKKKRKMSPFIISNLGFYDIFYISTVPTTESMCYTIIYLYSQGKHIINLYSYFICK